jgi:hypothetical protein
MASPAHDDEVTDTTDASYIDYDHLLSPSFTPQSFANTLVLSTNNPTDTPLDLSTPLSRVLFDIQEIDSHIDTLTSQSALPLLTHTKIHDEAAVRIEKELSKQVESLNESYKRLEKEVLQRYEAAEEVRMVSERLWHTVRLGRSVGRALQLGRQLEVQMGEQPGRGTQAREDYKAMVRASNTILQCRALFDASGAGEEGEDLDKVKAIAALRKELIAPAERTINTRSQQIIKDFSMSTLSGSGAGTWAQSEDAKARTTAALQSLYLLSPQTKSLSQKKQTRFEADWMVAAVTDYLRTALTTSTASIARALTNLPTLERTLLEVATWCQNIVAMELLLASLKPPQFPIPTSSIPPKDFLEPVLSNLETSSLPSYFWRSLASSLSSRVQEMVGKGGTATRALRTNKNMVRDLIREAVMRGSQAPSGVTKLKDEVREVNFEREVAVMAGAVVGHLGR